MRVYIIILLRIAKVTQSARKSPVRIPQQQRTRKHTHNKSLTNCVLFVRKHGHVFVDEAMRSLCACARFLRDSGARTTGHTPG